MELSIVVLSYNQKSYIQKCVESIIKQHISFSYEVILGDDDSNDGTRELLREYVKKDPSHFKLLKNVKNLGIKRNLIRCISCCTGKYIAFLEGDDYWLDCNKLEKQYVFLENHPEFSAVYHNYALCDQYGNTIENYNNRYQNGEYTIQMYKKFLLPSQSSTAMVRNLYDKLTSNQKRMINKVKYMPPDRLFPLILLKFGRMYCLNEKMSVHRKTVSEDGTNWSSIHRMEYNPNYLYCFMIFREMDLLLVQMKYSNKPNEFVVFRNEMYSKAKRAIYREKRWVWMWIQSMLMQVLEPT